MQRLGHFLPAISTDIAQEMQNSTKSRGTFARGMLRITLILWSGGNIFWSPRSEFNGNFGHSVVFGQASTANGSTANAIAAFEDGNLHGCLSQAMAADSPAAQALGMVASRAGIADKGAE